MYDFGNEDHSHVTNRQLRMCLIAHHRGVVRYIKYVFFNDDVPQNRTINYDPQQPNIFHVREKNQLHPLPMLYVLDTIVIEAWKRIVDIYKEIEQKHRLEHFKSTLVCTATFDRIEAFVRAYEDICQGELTITYKDVRDEVMKMIVGLTEHKLKKKAASSRKKKN